jgi:SAM-dependent methyltransferase
MPLHHAASRNKGTGDLEVATSTSDLPSWTIRHEMTLPDPNVDALTSLVTQIANREVRRAEATVQADVRQLLLTAALHLEDDDVVVLEAPVGGGRRIDVEVGATVIEVKRDLRKGKVRDEAIVQLAGYIADRERKNLCRYVGILTDGAEWRCYRLAEDTLAEVCMHSVDPARVDAAALVSWLEGVMATTRGARPTPDAIAAGLGAGSSSHALDRATLAALYQRGRDIPSVKMKRGLWARLLTTALGTQFKDDDELFIEHSLLVNSAEIIAHAVLDLPIAAQEPRALLSGSKFEEAGVYGVVEMDFFDWVLEVPGGAGFVQTLSRRLDRFDWSKVEHDVLKVLYESIIGKETRKKLGEYYTPDWLAERIVSEVVTDPLRKRVLDPACGSGTFLFQAVRRFIATAEAAGWDQSKIITDVTKSVIGVDLHPVAVALARVTYLLAIGRERLIQDGRPEIRIPVYLGDSMQWRQIHGHLWAHGKLTIETDDQRELVGSELQFPERLLADSARFDDLVQQLVTKASARKPGAAVPSIKPILNRLGIAEADRETITTTFKTLCRLHDEGRDHIWGYFVRNLARPIWLAREENRVDILIGNPPWLAYRHMSKSLQSAFKAMIEARELWHGAKVATHQDLSALFVARSVQLYLKRKGTFAFVMPSAVIDRAQFAGFRKAIFPDKTEPVYVAFGQSWDLRRLRPHFFPRGCAVITGKRVKRAIDAVAMSPEVDEWRGRVDSEHASWQAVEPGIKRSTQSANPVETEALAVSVYSPRFGQGATIVPRVLFMVEKQPSGALGLAKGRARIRSKRSSNEKKPWRDLRTLEGVVETEFLRPVYLGENILPYRAMEPALAILPLERQRILHSREEHIDSYPGLAEWMRQAEGLWEEHRSSERLSFAEQLDYHGKLSRQFPIGSERVVYTKSGMHIAAARVHGRRAVIDHTLYWANVTTANEAWYLCAILNSALITQRVRPLMSYGKDERHIDKYVWRLPIPEYDESNKLHKQLSELGQKAEKEVASLEIRATGFTAQRRQVREYLADSNTGTSIEALIERLLR